MGTNKFSRLRSIMTLSIGVITLTLGLSFNSCSDVNFGKSLSHDVNKKCVSEACIEGGDPGGGIDPVPPQGQVTYTDVFSVPVVINKADILLVVDNSESMTQDLKKLGEKLDGLVANLDKAGVDWQMCYVFTDLRSAQLALIDWKKKLSDGRVVSSGLKVLKSSTADRQNLFLTSMSSVTPSGNGNERGLKAARLTLEDTSNRDCFRDDAALSVVVISDEDQKSCGGRCETSWDLQTMTARPLTRYTEQFVALDETDAPQFLLGRVKGLWPLKPFTFHAIVIRPGDNLCYHQQDTNYPAFFGKIYAQTQEVTGGILGDICAASYAEQLAEMGTRVRESINSLTLRCAPISTPTVTFVPEPSPRIGFSYSGDKVLFKSELPQGTKVTITYTCLK